MKGIIKLTVNLLALVMLLVASLGLTACSEDEVVVEFQLEIYNSQEYVYYEDTTLTVTLHREYAPKTVDAIVSYIEEGYYDGAIFYGLENNKLMVGDLKMDANGVITQNALKPMLDTAEIENGGAVSGSTLTATEGTIGLWRTWFERDGYNTSASLDTGRATLFMPTGEEGISDYNGWFCFFATIDLEDETNATTIENLKSAVYDNAETYEVYYTGEYDATKDDENNGLTFNCKEEVPSDATVFVPKGEQYLCYLQHQIKIAKGKGNACGAKIVSAKVI